MLQGRVQYSEYAHRNNVYSPTRVVSRYFETLAHRYQLALRFAAFFNSKHRYDIVHDAFIYYLDKTKTDLFEIELKNESSFSVHRGEESVLPMELQGENWGEVYPVTSRAHVFRGVRCGHLAGKVRRSLGHLIGSDLYEYFYRKLYLLPNRTIEERTESRQLIMDIFKLKASGHTQREIGEELGASKQLVNLYVKKIEAMSQVTNPFVGSSTVINKKVSEVAWSEREDRESMSWKMRTSTLACSCTGKLRRGC